MGYDSYEVNDLNITIRSNYKVISNADEVNNFKGVYKWTFDPSDSDKILKITFTDQFSITAWLCNINPVIYYVIIGVIILCIFVVISLYFIRKSKKMNEI